MGLESITESSDSSQHFRTFFECGRWIWCYVTCEEDDVHGFTGKFFQESDEFYVIMTRLCVRQFDIETLCRYAWMDGCVVEYHLLCFTRREAQGYSVCDSGLRNFSRFQSLNIIMSLADDMTIFLLFALSTTTQISINYSSIFWISSCTVSIFTQSHITITL